MGRNYLWHREGEATNAAVDSASCNFHRIIRRLEILLLRILQFAARFLPIPGSNPALR